jgi:hypothetical protein
VDGLAKFIKHTRECGRIPGYSKHFPAQYCFIRNNNVLAAEQAQYSTGAFSNKIYGIIKICQRNVAQKYLQRKKQM